VTSIIAPYTRSIPHYLLSFYRYGSPSIGLRRRRQTDCLSSQCERWIEADLLHDQHPKNDLFSYRYDFCYELAYMHLAVASVYFNKKAQLTQRERATAVHV